MLIAVVALVLIVSLALLTFPLLRKTSSPIPVGHEAAEDQERIDLEIERQTLLGSLAELETDLGQDKLRPEDYGRLKAIDERRLVGILSRLDQLSQGKSPPSRKAVVRESSLAAKWTTLVILCLLVIGSSTGIYFYMLSVHRTGQLPQQQAMPQGMPNPIEMVARLEERLRQNPNDLEGQLMAGRSYMTLNRTEDARKAWTKVIELDPRNHEAHLNLGLVILQSSPRENKNNLVKAVEHFGIAEIRLPKEPVLLWYKGVALVHLERYAEADESWTAAFVNVMPGSEDAEFIRRALQDLRAGNPPLF